MLCALFTQLMAQVKGHAYYAFETALDDEIPSAILLEVENDGMLALGMIMYEQTKEPILLYGRRDRKDENTLHMEEHLLNGQWTGKMDLYIKDGGISSGVWKSPNEDRSYEISVKKRVPFPYNIVKTFFFPAKKEQMKGHYINYIRQGKAISNDRALNIMPMAPTYGFFSVEQSGSTLVKGNYNPMGENEFMFTTIDENEREGTLAVRVFENFVDVSALMADEDTGIAKSEGFYIREKGVLEMTTWGPLGDLFSVRARLEDGTPSLIVSKKRYEQEKQYFSDAADIKPGRHQLTNVAGPVIDMYLSDIGMEINPHLFLLLEDHRVQMISLENFRQTGVTHVGDPFPNVTDIQSILPYDPNNQRDTSEDEYDDGGIEIYGIDSEGKAHSLRPAWDTGDFLTNPEKGSVSGDGYLGMGSDWSLHIITVNGKEEFSYFGQYWFIEAGEEGTKIGYRLTTKRNNAGEMTSEPCLIEGTFLYDHDSDDWSKIKVTPLEGLMFTPKGKPAVYVYQTAMG